MKRKAFAIILLAFGALTISAQTQDSIITIHDAERIIITESPAGLQATIKKANETTTIEQSYSDGTTITSRLDSGFSLTNNKHSKSPWKLDAISGGFGVGFCSAPGAPEAAGIEMGKSFEISWLNIIAARVNYRDRTGLSLGVGINWRNYRTTLDNRFIVNDGQVSISAYPEGVEKRLSRIKIFSVQFPLLFHQRLFKFNRSRSISLKLGPVFNLNSHASVFAAWRDGDQKSEYKVNGINVRPFTIDLFAMLNLWSFGVVYARYSPYNALTGNNGCNFHQFSTGLMFAL